MPGQEAWSSPSLSPQRHPLRALGLWPAWQGHHPPTTTVSGRGLRGGRSGFRVTQGLEADQGGSPGLPPSSDPPEPPGRLAGARMTIQGHLS